ncbi:hypothetical protein HOLDEFILI_01830 [Holdemania filiformis DSM 12042]|uniref:Uncharacterized protein n=1 Tax=Holdemania filiformis DSM 12042 TaxID=545696 RepID=B9Y7N5_9FIRM|nr:hypothetical protein HOLDEFILI_01830 [Holdemania filiformis DSM 12042]
MRVFILSLFRSKENRNEPGKTAAEGKEIKGKDKRRLVLCPDQTINTMGGQA